MTQSDKILAMLSKGPVTAMDAFQIGIFRLAARIHDLRQEGHRIESKLVNGKTKGTYYSEYRMIK